MKNDYDFIKEKFEQSGVNAPEKMDESYVLDRLPESTPEIVKPKRKVKKLPAIAACAAVLIAAAVAVNMLVLKPTAPAQKSAARQSALSELVKFDSEQALREQIEKIEEKNRANRTEVDYEAADSLDIGVNTAKSASSTKTTGANTAAHSETYKQVEGVDEADIVKTNGEYIFSVTNSDYVAVIKPDGKNSKVAAKINSPDKEASSDIYELFISGDRLVVIRYYESFELNDDGEANKYVSKTAADIYDITNAEKPVLENTFSQSGYYISSRMIGNKLYLVSSDSGDSDRVLPVIACGNDERKLDCGRVYSFKNPASRSMLVITQVDITDMSESSDTKAVLGSGDTVYCNENNLYVTAQSYPVYFDYGYEATDDEADDLSQKIRILKVNIEDGVKFTASCSVKGFLNDQYSLDENNGYLRVAVTSNENGRDVNNLYVLDSKLSQVGEVGNFAKNESIKAVKYVGDTAYVITYEKTDPLFVIDLSKPDSPKILGSVKISGFSSMLVPVDENTVLGIGYHTAEEDWTDLEVQEGVKLALFDVSDKTAPKVLDSKIFENCESPVQYEPKALAFNPDRGSYTMPLNRFIYDDDYSCVAGALTVKVRGGKIEVEKLYESKKLSGEDDEGVNRTVYIGDTVYLICTDTYDDNSPTVDCFKY